MPFARRSGGPDPGPRLVTVLTPPGRPAQLIFPPCGQRPSPGRDPYARNETQDLKAKTPTELLTFAEEHEVENASTMRKQELMFAILKKLAARRSRSSATASSRCCRTASASCARPTPTTCPVPTTSTSRPSRSAASACAPATRSKARSAAQGGRALLRAGQGQQDQLRGPREGRATRSTSTT